MAKWSQGEFVPKNKNKYVGTYPIKYRSSWELTFMNLCDKHPSIVSWASESIKIPYTNPFTKKHSIYIPDFFIVYVDKNGKQHGEIVEIKPKKETVMEHAKSRRDKMYVALNQYKWQAAQIWCKKNNIGFRVMTEEQLFNNPGKK